MVTIYITIKYHNKLHFNDDWLALQLTDMLCVGTYHCLLHIIWINHCFLQLVYHLAYITFKERLFVIICFCWTVNYLLLQHFYCSSYWNSVLFKIYIYIYVLLCWVYVLKVLIMFLLGESELEDLNTILLCRRSNGSFYK